MNDINDNPPPNEPEGPEGRGNNGESHEPDDGTIREEVRHQPVGARLPEGVAGGIFATGAVVLEGPEEFVVDFIQGMTRPPRVATRVVMSPRVMGQFVDALRQNLDSYGERFGPPKEMPRPKPKKRPSLQEMYSELKIADDQLAGAYANSVMIRHSPAEFSFDFITRFYPTAAVAARVYVSASQAPRVLETMTKSFNHFREKHGGGPAGPETPPEPPDNPPAGDDNGET